MKKFLACALINLLIVGNLFSQYNLHLNYNSNDKPDKDTSVYKLKKKRLPELNGFRFLSSDLVRDPFITTYFRSTTGAGEALSSEAVVRNLRGDTLGTYSLNISYVRLGFEYQQAVNDWLAFRAGVDAVARISTSVSSLLSSGISFLSGYQIGGMARIWHTKKLYLSGTLAWNGTAVTHMSPYDFAKKIQETGEIDLNNAELVNVYHSGILGTNLNLAYSPIKWCGFTALAGYGMGNPFSSKNKGMFFTGATAGIDFQNLTPVPIGISIAYGFSTVPSTGDNVDNVSAFSFIIAYTGHSDFDIGLESNYQKFKQQGTDFKANTSMMALKMRYYF